MNLGCGWSSDLNLVLNEKNLGSPFKGSIKIYLATLYPLIEPFVMHDSTTLPAESTETNIQVFKSPIILVLALALVYENKDDYRWFVSEPYIGLPNLSSAFYWAKLINYAANPDERSVLISDLISLGFSQSQKAKFTTYTFLWLSLIILILLPG